MPEGSSVTWSSQRSASRSASATAVCSACDVGWWPAASWLIAPWRARSQLTGPPDQLISFCSSANSGILPSRSSGEPPPAMPPKRAPRPNGSPAGSPPCRAPGARDHGRAARSRTAARHSWVHGRRVIFRRRRSRVAPWADAGAQESDIGSPVVTRRIAVLTAGVVLLVLFGLLGTMLPVPYVAQVPGPTYNTLGKIDGSPIISIEGRDRNDGQRQPQPDHRRGQPGRAQPRPGGPGLVRRRGQPSSPRSRCTRPTAPRRRPGRPTGRRS